MVGALYGGKTRAKRQMKGTWKEGVCAGARKKWGTIKDVGLGEACFYRSTQNNKFIARGKSDIVQNKNGKWVSIIKQDLIKSNEIMMDNAAKYKKGSAESLAKIAELNKSWATKNGREKLPGCPKPQYRHKTRGCVTPTRKRKTKLTPDEMRRVVEEAL